MSVQNRGFSNVIQEVDTSRAGRMSLQPPSVVAANGGRYEVVLSSGLVTLLSAHTATAGHFAWFRNPSATKSVLVDYIKIAGAMVTDFTTFQRLSLSARIARAYTASHTGGTAATLTGNNAKLRTSYATMAAVCGVSTTGDLTAGTHVIDIQPFMGLIVANSSDAITTKRTPSETVREGHSRGPVILVQDEGIVFSNDVLMGAAGTAGLQVTVGWREVLNAEVPSGI